MTDIATLGLEIRSDTVPQASNRLKEFRKEAGLAEAAAGSLKRLATMGLAALAAGFAAFGVGIGAAVKRMEEMDRLSRMIDQGLKNSGNSARTSAKEIEAWADALEDRTGRAAEEVMGVATNLASFGFGRSEFFRSLELADDMAAAWGGDMKQNLEGLARALDDPLKGMAMLSQRGIKLTDEQKAMAAAFLDANDKVSAQGVVLDALEAQVRGVAEKGYGGLTKAFHQAQKAWDDAFESMVRGDGQTKDLRDSLVSLAETISSPQLIGAVTQFGTVFVRVLNAIAEGSVNAANNIRLITDFFANSRGDLQGMSSGGLEDKMRDIGMQRVALDRQIMETQSRLNQGGAATLFGINNGALNGTIANSKEQLQGLAEQERQILALLDQRDAANAPSGPVPGSMEGFGIVNPYAGQDFTTDATSKANEKARKAYDDLTLSANQFIASQGLEAQALGMTQEAANRLRHEQDLLNQAASDGLKLGPQQTEELRSLAEQMAAAEERTRQLTDAYNTGKQVLGSFLSDFAGGLKEGMTMWDAFAQAGINALDSLANKAMEASADGEWAPLWGGAAA